MVATGIFLASFWLSKAFDNASQALAASSWRRCLVVGALAVIVLAGVAALSWGRSGAVQPAQLAAALGQLAIALLFAWRIGPLLAVR